MTYPSVDAALDDLTKDLPLYEHVKATMERSGDAKRKREVYTTICKTLELLKDRDSFRQRLEPYKRPDGSIQMPSTQEAGERARQFEETVR